MGGAFCCGGKGGRLVAKQIPAGCIDNPDLLRREPYVRGTHALNFEKAMITYLIGGEENGKILR